MIYDRFQQEAIDHINNGHSVIVSAPTGAGKTAIAEYIISNAIKNNLGVIYTAPIKALSNQKFRDFQGQFQDNIGILTGDVSINPQAPVLIMTTEIFRNKILDEPESLNKYSWIIFDEIHYIDNPERGTVWEESLIFLPKHMNLLGLSATIPNIKQFAAWIESIHNKPIQVVIEENRPVPLHFLFQCQNEVVDKIERLKRLRSSKPNRLNSLVDYLRENDGLPAIYFVFSRKRAEELAQDLYGFKFLDAKESRAITQMYEDLLVRFNLKHEQSAQILYPLVQRGIAYHHAGMLPTLKEVIERLFTSRLLKVIFTTETFALGINMPSRSVMFDGLRKFYGTYVRNLKTRDFYQMAGRAGRRGIDKEGFVYTRVNPQRINFEEVNRIIYGKPEEVRSQLNTSYATILNLYEKYQEDLFKIYPLSLHYYQSNKNEQKQALNLLDAKLRLLKDLNYIYEGKLTEKGKFAKTVYGYELVLAELYDQNILEQLDEFGLGVVASAVVFEPRKNQRMPTGISKSSRELKRTCEETYDRIKDKERRYKIYPFSKLPYFHLCSSIEAWLRGTNFDRTLQMTDCDEGEVVRYFRMSVQVLREISQAPIASYLLKEKIKETIRVINRDIVDAEKQLREG
ncbi:MAG: DEAD/DEAH box helicase [Candidatus Omnitrophica bacterium]|jgi:superfamily II RNA helicase|nr:DEAD/DEAH box helicase [Candidatus Omnitrophota bacterium]MDD5252567.1 DEAD/DEAH box helicase [Candidatus Omnitrophota bacterium]